MKPQEHKALDIAKTENDPYVKPSIDNAINGSYPISRPLYWYTNGEPQGDIKKLLDFVLSPDGQKLVDELGFAPIKKG